MKLTRLTPAGKLAKARRRAKQCGYCDGAKQCAKCQSLYEFVERGQCTNCRGDGCETCASRDFKAEEFGPGTATYGPVHIPPRPEFATAQECKPEIVTDNSRVNYSALDELANALARLDEMEIELSGGVVVPLELAKAVYKELAPGFVGKAVRELLKILGES